MLPLATPLNFLCELEEKKFNFACHIASFSKGNDDSDLLSREMPKLD